ncbi:hypothetical protein ACA910_005020 [Epithemia clementina (nom. ined.)]
MLDTSFLTISKWKAKARRVGLKENHCCVKAPPQHAKLKTPPHVVEEDLLPLALRDIPYLFNKTCKEEENSSIEEAPKLGQQVNDSKKETQEISNKVAPVACVEEQEAMEHQSPAFNSRCKSFSRKEAPSLDTIAGNTKDMQNEPDAETKVLQAQIKKLAEELMEANNKVRSMTERLDSAEK